MQLGASTLLVAGHHRRASSEGNDSFNCHLLPQHVVMEATPDAAATPSSSSPTTHAVLLAIHAVEHSTPGRTNT
jgi:hypothetical protein